MTCSADLCQNEAPEYCEGFCYYHWFRAGEGVVYL